MRFLERFKANARLAAEVTELRDSFTALEKRQEAVELDMEEWYGRMRRVLATIARREARANAAGELSSEEPGVRSASPPPSGYYAQLQALRERHNRAS